MSGGTFRRQTPTCAAAEAVWVGEDLSAAGRAAAEWHLEVCPRCQARGRRLSLVREAVVFPDARLPELTRARVEDRIFEALAAPTPARARPRTWRWPLLAAGLAIAAVAALVALPRTDPPRSAALRPATGPQPAGAPRTAPAVPLRPSAPAAPPPGASRTAMNAVDLAIAGRVVTVPAGRSLRARLGERGRVLLVGPARVRVREATSARVELALGRGMLIADYARGGGALLRIVAPQATTEVLGTIFAVEATAGPARVSVSRGAVRVTAAGGSAHTVKAGQEWTARDGRPVPMGGSTRALHAAFVDGGADGPAPPAADPVVGGLFDPGAGREPRRAARLAVARPTSIPAGEPSPPPAVAFPPDVVVSPPPVVASPPAGAPSPPPASPPGEAVPPEVPPAPAPTADMKPQPPAPDAAELYAQAEAAMGRGRPAEARERLERLLARHPRHRLAEPARYELAQMALEAGHPGAAASQLDALLATALDPALEEPARHLRCRVERVAGRPREAAECLRRFRRDFPGSTRDLEALRALLELMSPAERCAEGREELRELVRLAAAGRHAPRARAWTEECGR